MALNFLHDFNTFVGISTILGTIAAWIALYPIIRPYIQKFTGKIPNLSASEESYLQSLAKDLELKNHKNRWSDRFYINVDTELQQRDTLYDIPSSFYVVKTINPHLKEQDFNNLSNVEKIDSSRGRSFTSLQAALTEAQDNAVVIIAPPGNGKTVSLRNLAIKKIKDRLTRKSKLVPIFVNLGYYTGFNPDGSIKSFDVFLDEFFSSSGYHSYLSKRHWERLLRQGGCLFFLDGVDELPRRPGEYEARSQKIADFVRAWPNTQFILACRELDYNRELSLQQVLIKPFDRKHIQSYMKKYFSRAEYKLIFRQIEETPGIYELCGNPFYLDLICYFSRLTKKIPENKAQLFNFIISQFIERENQKQGIVSAPSFQDDFILVLSHLAYYLAIEKMVTTAGIDEYANTIRDHKTRDMYIQMIQFAIKGELLEFNEKSREIRFIHNRFQEFFSSYYILKHYREEQSILPENVFTNLWWKETVLFVAGLEYNVDDLIALILKQRDNFTASSKVIENLLKLEMTALAFECIFGNLAFNNDALYEQLRDDLMRQYRNGNTLIKAKVLTAFRSDKSAEVLTFIQKALDDESLWVSERAFFMLSDEQLKIKLTPSGILQEFFRFFIEGRLINTFIPIIKSVRKSRLIMIFLPVYLFLSILNLFCIFLVGYVFYSFIEHLIFKLEYTFTAACLGCLFSIAVGTYTIIYCLTNNNYAILKRFIYAAPVALVIRYLVFNIPSNLFYKLAMLAMAYLFVFLYWRFLKKPNESDFSAGAVTAFVFGFAVLVPLFSFDQITTMLKFPATAKLINNNKLISNIIQVVESEQPLLMLGALIAICLYLGVYIYRQARLLTALNDHIKQIDIVLVNQDTDEKRTQAFKRMFESLSMLWAQNFLLKLILEKMTTRIQSTREQKMSFLDYLAKTVNNVPLRDSIYQHLEDEENNFRRSLKANSAHTESSEELRGSRLGISSRSRLRFLSQQIHETETYRETVTPNQPVRFARLAVTIIVILAFVSIPLTSIIFTLKGKLSPASSQSGGESTSVLETPTRATLLSDDFNENQNGWFVGENPASLADIASEIRDGAYNFSAKVKADNVTTMIPVPKIFEKNFGLGFDVTVLDVSDINPFSITVGFRYVDARNHYLVRFSQNRFRIDSIKNNNWKAVTDWMINDDIRLEKGIKNRFDVFAQGSTISIFVNNQPIYSVEDSTLSDPGYLRIGVDSVQADQTITIKIDHVIVVNQ